MCIKTITTGDDEELVTEKTTTMILSARSEKSKLYCEDNLILISFLILPF